MKKISLKKLISLVLAVLLVLSLFAGCTAKTAITRKVHNTPKEEKAFGKLLLSVNPEIEIEYDEEGIVVELEGKNDEGREIVKRYRDLVGKDSETVVKELVQEIYNSGYFDNTIDGNSRNIIVKLEDGSSYPDNGFLERVVAGVREAVNANNISSETIAVDKTNLNKDGLIGIEKAKETVLTQLGIKNAVFHDQEYDLEDGVYEFEFVANGMEYEYEVDAVTGKVVKAEQEKKNPMNDPDDDQDDDPEDDLDDQDDDFDDRDED